jgi:hypothetical protein
MHPFEADRAKPSRKVAVERTNTAKDFGWKVFRRI